MKTISQETQDYIDTHHAYTPKTILRESLFMFTIFFIQISYSHGFAWGKLGLSLLFSVAAGFGHIAFHRIGISKGWIKIPPQPKYSLKTYAEHQADKAAKAAETRHEVPAKSKDV